MDSRLTSAGMTTLERIPALGAAEFQAKSGLLANLFERSELFATMIWPGTKVPQRGRGQAEVVLPTFAETKVGHLAGAKPRITFRGRMSVVGLFISLGELEEHDFLVLVVDIIQDAIRTHPQPILSHKS